MENFLSGKLSESAQSQLNHFKEYAVSHPQLTQVDMLLMGAIRFPGFLLLMSWCMGLPVWGRRR